MGKKKRKIVVWGAAGAAPLDNETFSIFNDEVYLTKEELQEVYSTSSPNIQVAASYGIPEKDVEFIKRQWRYWIDVAKGGDHISPSVAIVSEEQRKRLESCPQF